MSSQAASAPVQEIILDTNILQYTRKKEIVPHLLTYLQDVQNRKFGLAISEISVLELLDGATIENEKKGASILSKFKRFLVDSQVLTAASQLTTLYNQEKIPSQQISVQDKIIAATAILTGSLIMTADIGDFPRPFFSEAEEKHIIYKEKNKSKLLVLQLLSPNQLVIRKRFLERARN